MAQKPLISELMQSQGNNFTNNVTFIPKRIAPLTSSTESPFSFTKVLCRVWTSSLPGLHQLHPQSSCHCCLANGASHSLKLGANEIETALPHGEKAALASVWMAKVC